MLDAEKPRYAAPEPSRATILKDLREAIIAEWEDMALKPANLKEDASLAELGFDSLDSVELAMAVEDWMIARVEGVPPHTTFTDEEIEKCGTFGDLVTAAEKKIIKLRDAAEKPKTKKK